MKWPLLHLNLTLAWVWILAGFISGLVLGLKFHHENWLGGYSSLKRRLYRLGHISFFGLALINLMFYFTAAQFPTLDWNVRMASGAFLVGALSMPVCCWIMAQNSKWHLIFSVPVLSLLAGSVLTLWEIIQL